MTTKIKHEIYTYVFRVKNVRSMALPTKKLLRNIFTRKNFNTKISRFAVCGKISEKVPLRTKSNFSPCVKIVVKLFNSCICTPFLTSSVNLSYRDCFLPLKRGRQKDDQWLYRMRM